MSTHDDPRIEVLARILALNVGPKPRRRFVQELLALLDKSDPLRQETPKEKAH